MARKKSLGGTLLILVIALVVAWSRNQGAPPPATPEQGSNGPAATSPRGAAAGSIERLFAEKRSDTWVEGRGTVRNVLADDNEGSRHQRFILALPSGHTVLVAHNIDLAPRVPLEAGDSLGFRGEYEWNDRGGVVHWTHHDPRGRHQGGHLSLDGREYR